MHFPDDPGEITVAVVGLGYVGACVAAATSSRGMRVVGVDVDPGLIEELNRGHCRFHEEQLAELLREGMEAGRLRVTTDAAAVAEADVVVVAVGTPVDGDGSLADGQLRQACETLSRHLRRGQLVLLKSTVPPGVTREVVAPLLAGGGLTAGEDFGLAFTPERLAEGRALRELRAFPVVVGGVDARSTAWAADFWRMALEVEVIPTGSLEAAEIVKLADNWWIDLNIALANELAKFCSLFDVDALEVIAAANTIPKGGGNVNILLPSVGVGGSCLTKDPLMVRETARRRGLEILTVGAGREVNAGMPEYTARLIADELAELGKDVSDAKVAVLGLAFKNDTGDLRATPTHGVIERLAASGADVRLYDPLVDADAAEKLFGIRPVATLDEAVRDVDCLAILALHRQFADIDFGALPVASSCLMLDGRAYFSKERIAEFSAQGYVYRGIGRPPAGRGTRTEKNR